jgi:hypothetical protein
MPCDVTDFLDRAVDTTCVVYKIAMALIKDRARHSSNRCGGPYVPTSKAGALARSSRAGLHGPPTCGMYVRIHTVRHREGGVKL